MLLLHRRKMIACDIGKLNFSVKEITFYRHYTLFFYKNFGSAPSTKSFLISHENFAITVLKVS